MSSDDEFLRYTTGEVAETGDAVLIEQGRTPGEVDAVIASVEQQQEWGVDEPGLMIRAAPFGLVFWPQSDRIDPVKFVARKAGNQTQ
ncbi:hypothetical protein [Pseudomonas turukhanskensis]|uniref:Uncharacterized protein n=1 Tax=Pseudomonas turukhanskensis TaxID=1806536 RepID=A0A9W6NEJ5_9PSED|nr:hypothetical protein [Pseudomonas turukhanskensis]GLK87837.1 hypothetical protein GCM10017655_08990 [Pseudomonas turukhanskensis]